MKKRTFSILALVLALIMVLAACTPKVETPDTSTPEIGTSMTPDPTPPEAAEPEEVIIGVLQYDNTDASQIAINDYMTKVLGPMLNIKFIFSENIASAEQEIAFYEQIAAAGAKGVNCFYMVASPEAIAAKIEETGLYYVINGSVTEELKAAFENIGSDKWVACLGGGGGDYQDMRAITERFLEKGDRTFVIATGAKDFGIEMFIDRYMGCVDAINEWTEAHPDDPASFTEFGGFPDDYPVWSANVQQTIDSEPDAVLATFSGEQLWATQIAQSGKDIDLGTASALNDAGIAALADGSLDILSARHPQANSVVVLALYNAITEGSSWFEGELPCEIPILAPIFTSDSNASEYFSEDFRIFSEDEIKSVLKFYNPSAKLADLIKLSEKSGLGLA